MKKEAVAYLTLSIILVLALIIIISYPFKIELQFSPAEFSPPIPQNCSNESIKSLWDYVFNESSEGITIIKNESLNYTLLDFMFSGNISRCLTFIAYKIKNNEELYLIRHFSLPLFFLDISFFPAIKANATIEYLNIIKNLTESNLTSETNFLSQNSERYPIIPLKYLKQENRTIENVKSSLEFAFNIGSLTDFSSNISKEDPRWLSIYYQNGTKNHSTTHFESMEIKEIELESSMNYTFDELLFAEFFYNVSLCKSNWTAKNTSCSQNENYTIYYEDNNSCIFPNSPQLANETRHCDYDNNGLIGKEENIKQSNIKINLSINSEPINYSKNYNQTQKVEIKENNMTRVELNYEFKDPLNLNDIKIEKQPSDSKFGYIIINGLNCTKTLTIDRINSSNSKICLINDYVSDISQFSSNCNSSREVLINCPEAKSGFICVVNNNTFVVSGLSKSGVKEFLAPQASPPNKDQDKDTDNSNNLKITVNSNCTPNWSCVAWTACVSNKRTRTCIDLNKCNVSSTKPIESESCVTPCSPAWNCTSWTKCPKNKTQTKTCIDLNNCGTNDLKPKETQTCEYKMNLFDILSNYNFYNILFFCRNKNNPCSRIFNIINSQLYHLQRKNRARISNRISYSTNNNYLLYL